MPFVVSSQVQHFAGKSQPMSGCSAPNSLSVGKFEPLVRGTLAKQSRELHAGHRVPSDDHALCEGQLCDRAKQRSQGILTLWALRLELLAVEHEDAGGSERLRRCRRVDAKGSD